MKIRSLLVVSISLVIFSTATLAQAPRRPVRPTAKPAVADPKPTPAPKTVTPEQAFFNDGMKCPKDDFDCQVSNYTKAINLGLNTKEVFKNRGSAYQQRKDYDKAVADLTKLIELDPNDTTGYKDRGKLYLEISNSPQAVNAAIRDFTSAIDLEPKDVEALKLRSSAYIKARNFDKAKVDMDKIAILDPTNIDLLLNQAQMYTENKEHDKAIESFSKALAVKVTPHTLRARAEALIVQKRYDLAIIDLTKAIDLSPQDAELYSVRGGAYLKLEKNDLATSDFMKEVELEPKRLGSLTDLAKTLEKQKKYEEAIKIYDVIVASSSKDELPKHLISRAWLNLNNQAPNPAMVDATRAIEIDPKNARAYEMRCIAFMYLKDYSSAIEECTDAIDLDQSLENAYINRGAAIVTMTGKLEGAAQSDYDKGYSNQIVSANRILSQNPDDFDSLVKRSLAYMVLKNYAASALDYKKLTEVHPNYEEAYAYLGSVNSLAVGITEATIPGNRTFTHQTLSMGISRNPDSVILYYYRGANYAWDDHRSSISDYLKAIENYRKKSKPTMSDRIFVRIAISQAATKYSLLKDSVSAISTISICDELFPDSVVCLKEKGDFYRSSLKDFQTAVGLYGRAIELYPSKKSVETTFDLPNTYYYLAESYFGLSDKPNAIATINKGLAQHPTDKTMWDYAAMFYKYNMKDTNKATEYYKKAAELGSSTALYSLNSIAEEKQRKKERRNATILAIMGAVNQGLETYNNNRRSTSPAPPPITSTRPQTTQTSSAPSVSAGSTSTTCNDGIQRGGTGFDCHQFVTSGHTVSNETTRPSYWTEICGEGSYCSQWATTPLQGILFRGKMARQKHATDKPYLWTIGFKNTTNAVVVFYPELIYGDGTTQPNSGGVALTPGSETVWHVTWGTNSGSTGISLRMNKYAICTNISKTADGYKCN